MGDEKQDSEQSQSDTEQSQSDTEQSQSTDTPPKTDQMQTHIKSDPKIGDTKEGS